MNELKTHPTDAYFDDSVRTISELIRFDSSLAPAEDGAPFGKGAADCLNAFLALADQMGFETHNYDGYVGEVVFGEGEELAVLAHLDVVPAGSGWTYPPFGGVINDDLSSGGVGGKKIWGRGAMDDKGPAVSCLYAMFALKESGFIPKRKIKFILGCNEECGWKCIEHYKKVAKMPREGFTPDANFPVIYAEKGILHVTTNFPVSNPPFSSFQGGERVNMVCDEITATVHKKAANALSTYQNTVAGTDFYFDNTTSILRATGKSAHGSTPHLGANALQAALAFFAEQNEDCKRAYEFLFLDKSGLKTLQDETGVLTLSPNLVSFRGGVLSVTIDIRYPATFDKQTVLEKFENFGVDYRIENYQAPLYNDPNGPLISKLMDVYNAEIGKSERPIAIGGGTYARALENGCAFGPEMEGDEITIHQADEYVTFERVRLMNRLYFDAIKALTE